MPKKAAKKKAAANAPKAVADVTSLPYALSQVNKRLAILETVTHCPVVIDRKDNKEMPAHLLMKRKGHGSSIGVRFSREKPYKCRVIERLTSTSSAASVLSTVSSLFPNNTTDAKIFAGVFDEVRCTGFGLRMGLPIITTATGVPSGPSLVGYATLAYDPTNNGAYTAMEQPLEAPYHLGPFPVGGLYSTQAVSLQQVGLPSMHVKVPATVDPGLVTDLLGSNWVSASDTGLLIGYLKPYVDSVGTATSSRVDLFVFYDMEYCFRT